MEALKTFEAGMTLVGDCYAVWYAPLQVYCFFVDIILIWEVLN
jgi:hypothetical protein